MNQMIPTKNFIHIPEVMLDGSSVDVIYRKGTPGKAREEIQASLDSGGFTHPFGYCPPLNPCTYVAADGIICERDVCVFMRDGIRLYCDIYSPQNQTEPLPVLLSWSLYGKRQAEADRSWGYAGVPKGSVSLLAKFEGGDPAYWCRQGYIMVNADARGIGNSEGNACVFGLQEGRDGCDLIDWIGEQSWCNGKVGMIGNSGLAIAQWFIAAEQPKHLACIAPWEGMGDLYRESCGYGGMDSTAFHNLIVSFVSCKGYIEDAVAMRQAHPFLDSYWESKIPRWDRIHVPAYICAGWCHFHLRGSIEAFRHLASSKKWLRAHREFEWVDMYQRDSLADLKLFFDRYLKEIHNGWESTPTVRMDLMDAYEFDAMAQRAEREFPLARTEYQKLYLNAANRSASKEMAIQVAEVCYDPSSEQAVFDYTFHEDTELTGYMKLKLYAECRGHDNMDLFVWIKKLGQQDEYLPVRSMGGDFRGAWGYQRVSQRALDAEKSTNFQPVAAHQSERRLSSGEVVPVEIEIWPHSRLWHKGETLQIEIAGRFQRTDWYEDQTAGFKTDNGRGTHVLHTGGDHAAYLQIPVIPPRYTSGEYTYR